MRGNASVGVPDQGLAILLWNVSRAQPSSIGMFEVMHAQLGKAGMRCSLVQFLPLGCGALSRIAPGRVVHPVQWPTFLGEHPFRIQIPLLADNRARHIIQHYQALLAVLDAGIFKPSAEVRW